MSMKNRKMTRFNAKAAKSLQKNDSSSFYDIKKHRLLHDAIIRREQEYRKSGHMNTRDHQRASNDSAFNTNQQAVDCIFPENFYNQYKSENNRDSVRKSATES